MLAKKHRLPINSFPVKAKVFYRGRHLTIKAASNNLPYSRVGIIVTKKTASGAVVRNRLRRKIFDLFGKAIVSDGSRLRQDFGEPRDLLVLVRPIRLMKTEEESLMSELETAVKKLSNVN